MTTKRQREDYEWALDAIEDAIQDRMDACKEQDLSSRHNAQDDYLNQLVGRLVWQLCHVDGGRGAIQAVIERN
jgi:hypothetical protein